MRNSSFLLLFFFLTTQAFGITFFERNSLSLQSISDIPVPVPPPSDSVPQQDAGLNSAPGVNDGYQGTPETPGRTGEIGGGNGGEGNEPGRGDAAGQEGAREQEIRTRQGESKERETREGESKERETREGESKERETREGESKERETREGESKERETRDKNDRIKDRNDREERDGEKNKQKNDAKPKKGVKPDGAKPSKDNGDGRFFERSGSNSDYREVARLAEGPSGSVSDMPNKINRPRTHEAPLPYWPIAATTIGTPSAHGADWTDVFAGIGVQNRARYGTLANSTAIVGLGFGDARKNVGLEMGISSFGLIRHGLPFTTGGVSLKLHHYFQDWALGVAAGYENAIYWGSPDSGQSFFMVFSKYIQLGQGSKHEPFRTLFIHFGLGDGRFRNEGSVMAGRNSISPFVSMALRVADPINMIANWTGSDLSLGISTTPFRSTPIGVGISALDILKQAGDGVRFSLVISYGDSVKNPSFPVSWFRSEPNYR